jgi:hypothetical protein
LPKTLLFSFAWASALKSRARQIHSGKTGVFGLIAVYMEAVTITTAKNDRAGALSHKTFAKATVV